MQPNLPINQCLTSRQLVESYKPEDLEGLRLTESINNTLDQLEKTLLQSKERISKIQYEYSEKIRKTLKIVPFILFSAACAGFALGINKNLNIK